MDFDNILKSRKQVLKLLRLRGFNTEKYEQQTKEELNILFQNHSKKITPELESLDILLQNNDIDGSNILIKYVLVDKCRSKLLEKMVDTIYEETLQDGDTCVIITKDQVTYQGSLEDYVNKIFQTNKRFLQILYIKTLLFDITQHSFVPEYKILSDEEKKNVMEKYKLNENQLPRIRVSDPAASFYGIKVGQMVAINKSSDTGGLYLSYRICVT